jgi:hypothetical protein
MATLKADVWKYFSKIKPNEKDTKVKCELCSREFAYHGTTTNMRDHLSRVHKDQYQKSQSTSSTTQLTLVRKCSEARAAAIHQLLLDVVVLDMRPVAVVGMKRQYRTLDLKNEQWELLPDLAKPLELLEIATVFLSQEYNLSCSCVYPIIDGLINNLIPAEDDQPIIKQFKTTISAALRSRWKFTDIDILKPPALVSFFDPCFKGVRFVSDERKEQLKQYVLQLVKEVQLKELEVEIPQSPSKKRKTALDILLDGYDSIEEESHPDKDELYHYLAEKTPTKETQPLQWWAMNEHRFRKLSHLVKYYLSIPATSTPSEQLFSKAGNVINKKRNSLKPKAIDAILFLNANQNL